MHTRVDGELFQSGSRRFELDNAIPHRLEFEEFDDFAGDVSAVAHAIERDGMVVPEYGTFLFD